MFEATFSVLKSIAIKQAKAQAKEFAAKAVIKPSLDNKAAMAEYAKTMGHTGKASFGASDMIEWA